MFIDDTTLSEVLNVTNNRSDQPIGNMELNIQRISTFCGEQRMVLNVKKQKKLFLTFALGKLQLEVLSCTTQKLKGSLLINC
jgi:hypothetical protein